MRPALFLHPSDAVHGDLGMVRAEDVAICISKSGDTTELVNLIPLLKRGGVPIVAMLGNEASKIAQLADVVGPEAAGAGGRVRLGAGVNGERGKAWAAVGHC